MDFEVGDLVRSTKNSIYNGTYVVEKVLKTIVWVSLEENRNVVYKNVPKKILRKVVI